MKPKKVLIISFSFPPAGGSRVQRPLKFAKYLGSFGWEVYVVAAREMSGTKDLSLLEDIPKGMSVERVFSPDPVGMETALRGAGENGMNRVFYILLKVLLKVYSIVYYRVVTVDWYEGWVPFGLKAAEKTVRRENIDIIYVHGQPPSSFLIGRTLKKRTLKPLVIDYDDPWTTSVYARRDKRSNAVRAGKLEKEILSCADAVLSAKPDTIRDIKTAFPEVDTGKMHFLPNGYDPEDYKGIEKKRGGKFTITYVGRLSEKYCYSPESFLLALGALIEEGKISKDDIRVNFAGTISAAYYGRMDKLIKDLGLVDVINLLGFIGHRECMRLVVGSDLLLLLMESLGGIKESMMFAGSIPAKIFEYIPTGVPVLGIVPPGFESDLIRDTRTGFTAEANNVDSIKSTLEGIYRRYKTGVLGVDPEPEEIAKYDRKVLAGKLAAIMDALVAKDRKGNS
ncbi:MAG: glycosyltransferase [Candidatus Omnitrophica bacterium]|nr:glycosyltransferase [Candidatus Omnitrophota bacterium]